MTSGHTALQLTGITKTFGKLVANEDISLHLRTGEILAYLNRADVNRDAPNQGNQTQSKTEIGNKTENSQKIRNGVERRQPKEKVENATAAGELGK